MPCDDKSDNSVVIAIPPQLMLPPELRRILEKSGGSVDGDIRISFPREQIESALKTLSALLEKRKRLLEETFE